MKKTTLILALVILLKPIFPVIDYGVNYDYISQVLCENKDKPQMHCNGKCHLMKEMAKEAGSEKPISSDKKHMVSENEILFYQEVQSFKPIRSYNLIIPVLNCRYSDLYQYQNTPNVFRPPIFYV